VNLSLAAVGDVMLGDHPFRIGHGVGSMIRRRGPLHPFLHATEVLRKGDIRFCNLEGVLSTVSEREDALQSAQMRGEPNAVHGLGYAGFQIVSMANNHALDHGRTAYLQTLQVLKSHGMECIGLEERPCTQHKVLAAQGISIAFLGYCFVGLDSLFKGHDETGLATVREDIMKAREDADFVVVSAHWGREYIDHPSPTVVWLGHKIVDYGADVVLGHHPHVLQGIERYKGKLIAYSLGNFVFDMWGTTQESMILQIDLEKDSQAHFEAVPVLINDSYQPVPLVNERAKRIIRRVEALSEDLGTLSFGNQGANQTQYELLAKVHEAQYRRIMRRYLILNVYRYPLKYLVYLMKNSVVWHLNHAGSRIGLTPTEDEKKRAARRSYS